MCALSRSLYPHPLLPWPLLHHPSDLTSVYPVPALYVTMLRYVTKLRYFTMLCYVTMLRYVTLPYVTHTFFPRVQTILILSDPLYIERIACILYMHLGACRFFTHPTTLMHLKK